MTIVRTSTRILHLPGDGVRFVQPAGGAAPWWTVAGVTCRAAYQPKGAASLAASYVNLANPGTNDAAPGVAPTFDAATGWTFNGSTQWLTSGISPASTAWSLLVQYSGVTATNDSVPCGYYKGTAPTGAFMVLIAKSTSVSNMWAYNGGIFPNGIANAPRMLAGNYGFAGKTPYRNGSAEGNVIPAGTGTIGALYIGARNNGGVTDSFLNGSIQALAIYSATLTGPQVATVAAAMAAL